MLLRNRSARLSKHRRYQKGKPEPVYPVARKSRTGSRHEVLS